MKAYLLIALLVLAALVWFAQPVLRRQPAEKCVLDAPFSCDASLDDRGVSFTLRSSESVVEVELTLAGGCFAQERFGRLAANGGEERLLCPSLLLPRRFRSSMTLTYVQEGVRKGAEGVVVLRQRG